MITYSVKCQRFILDYSVENLTKVSESILSDSDLLDKIMGGDIEALMGLVYQEESSVRVFDGPIPIANRRAAMRHASSLGEMIIRTNEYNDRLHLQEAIERCGSDFVRLVQEQLGGKIKLFDVAVYMNHKEEELRLHGVVYQALSEDEQTLNNLTSELTIYEENGYDLGAEKAFVQYVPEMCRVVRVLPDAASYFTTHCV